MTGLLQPGQGSEKLHGRRLPQRCMAMNSSSLRSSPIHARTSCARELRSNLLKLHEHTLLNNLWWRSGPKQLSRGPQYSQFSGMCACPCTFAMQW
eukprot:447229-Pyramimonas_sp.AAC.1